MPSDPAIANGHEHAACNERNVRTSSPEWGQSVLPCERHKVGHCDLNDGSTRERAKNRGSRVRSASRIGDQSVDSAGSEPG